jgi:hypothetical protein
MYEQGLTSGLDLLEYPDLAQLLEVDGSRLALGNARKGKLKHGFAFAGKNAYRVEKVVSVRELMTALMEEFSRAAAESDTKGEAGYRRCNADFGTGIRVPQKCEDSAWLF